MQLQVKKRELTDSDFLELIQARENSFYRIAYGYVQNQEDAKDIVQEAVCKAYIGKKRLRDPEKFYPWFYRILVNTSIDTLRRRGRVYYTDALPEPEGEPSQESRVLDEVALYAAIDRLSPDVRTVILLRFFEDMKISEIADVTRTPLSTAKNRLYRGLAALRLDLEEGM